MLSSSLTHLAPTGSPETWNNQKWSTHKDEIYRMYIVDNNTLQTTMQRMEGKLGFKAKERTWKIKLKEWEFEKHISQETMRIIVAKAEKRARDGKDTVFFHRQFPIPAQRIENYKKRKATKAARIASPSADTIKYCIPHAATRDGRPADWRVH
ncbi:hypothetical protein B0J14DRAFT_312758 [Halenospora varia]|nr:hypothetical protein B0J14DRAFT_312758 [Halenospora varia]